MKRDFWATGNRRDRRSGLDRSAALPCLVAATTHSSGNCSFLLSPLNSTICNIKQQTVLHSSLSLIAQHQTIFLELCPPLVMFSFWQVFLSLYSTTSYLVYVHLSRGSVHVRSESSPNLPRHKKLSPHSFFLWPKASATIGNDPTRKQDEQRKKIDVRGQSGKCLPLLHRGQKAP